MSAVLEIIYIDSDEQARHTNMGLAFDTEAAARAEFEKCRAFEVDKSAATFLLDYHDGNEDLVDTIPLDDIGFVAITGTKKLSDVQYRKIDREYWGAARKQRNAV